jgi:hypothetical protein
MTSIVASLVLPAAIASVSIQIPRIPSLVSPAASSKVVVLRHGTVPGLSPSDWLGPGMRRLASQASVDTLLRRTWAAASLGLVGALLLSGAHLYWRRRRWTRGTMAGASVYITPDVGPAVVGLIRPQIAVPGWLLDCPSATQQLVISHERAHLEGNDVPLFTCALFLLAWMPWNLPLWWQLRRLRRAIEVDCDVRVLRQGGDVRTYGEVLLSVAQRHSGYVGAVAGMSESRSFLEQRIRLMLRQPVRWRHALVAGFAAVSLTLLTVAAEVEPPNAGGDHREIILDASVLDRYVGYYQFTPSVFLTITRDGTELRAQLTGQGAQPIYPETATRFFYKVVDAQIEFTADPEGKITALILHQHGEHRAPRVDADVVKASAEALATRMQAQTAQPGSAAAVGRLIEWITSGKPDYAAMTPELGAAMRRALPTVRSSFTALGPVVSVKFAGVGTQGWDLYDVTHERGRSQMRIILDADGIIAGALVTPGP